MQAEALQIKARCGEVVEKIKALYGMDLSGVRISFDLRGRSAGKAGGRGYRLPGSAYYVKFNRDMLTREAFEHVINNTVPHEYAHVVCFMDPNRGKNHDHGWERVCRSLGGSGARAHKEEVVYGKGLTYEYTTDRGHKVRLSEKRHRYVQGGGRLSYKRGMGVVSQLCAHSIVGARGRTLAQPIVKQAPNHPAQIEAAVARQRITITGTREVLLTTLFGTPVQRPTGPVQATFNSGESKANVARAIMLSGYRAGKTAAEMIEAIMHANGHPKALATSYYKNNVARIGIPADYV